MTAIKVKRTITRQNFAQSSGRRLPFRHLGRFYLASERKIEFVIEAFLFGIIVAVSAWPLFAAAGALGEFLQQAQV